MSHNHITRADVEGCPACDKREGRVSFIEPRFPPNARGVYAALTQEQFEQGAVEYDGIKLVGSEEGDYAWAYGHIDPEAFARAVDRLHVDYFGIKDHEPFDADTHVRHVQAVRVSPGADEWLISWADQYREHGERFPLTALSVEGWAS